MNNTQLCQCGCGAAVRPGRRFRKGHHLRLAEYRGRTMMGQALQRRERHQKLVTEFALRGGVVSMQEKTARWDDEWAIIGDDALRDTEMVMDILGRYGCVEVSYTAPSGCDDPLAELDVAVEALVETRRVKRIKRAFEKAGFSGLRLEEMEYLYRNGYETVEDFAI